jgi:hypothetical protein
MSQRTVKALPSPISDPRYCLSFVAACYTEKVSVFERRWSSAGIEGVAAANGVWQELIKWIPSMSTSRFREDWRVGSWSSRILCHVALGVQVAIAGLKRTVNWPCRVVIWNPQIPLFEATRQALVDLPKPRPSGPSWRATMPLKLGQELGKDCASTVWQVMQSNRGLRGLKPSKPRMPSLMALDLSGKRVIYDYPKNW